MSAAPGDEIDLDGMLNIAGSDECCTDLCRACGGRRHFQGIYGGYMDPCEQCDPGWRPPGTFKTMNGHGTIIEDSRELATEAERALELERRVQACTPRKTSS